MKLSICYEWFAVNIEEVNDLLLREIREHIYVGTGYI